MGSGTDDFKRLSKQHAQRGFHPETPTQAMPTPVTCGQKTLAEAMETVRQMKRVHEKGAFFQWRLALLREHGLYDPTPSREPRMWEWQEEPPLYEGPVEVLPALPEDGCGGRS